MPNGTPFFTATQLGAKAAAPRSSWAPSDPVFGVHSFTAGVVRAQRLCPKCQGPISDRPSAIGRMKDVCYPAYPACSLGNRRLNYVRTAQSLAGTAS